MKVVVGDEATNNRVVTNTKRCRAPRKAKNMNTNYRVTNFIEVSERAKASYNRRMTKWGYTTVDDNRNLYYNTTRSFTTMFGFTVCAADEFTADQLKWFWGRCQVALSVLDEYNVDISHAVTTVDIAHCEEFCEDTWATCETSEDRPEFAQVCVRRDVFDKAFATNNTTIVENLLIHEFIHVANANLDNHGGAWETIARLVEDETGREIGGYTNGRTHYTL